MNSHLCGGDDQTSLVFMETLLSLLHYFLSFVVVISVIVFVHEFGHYIVAKWCGVKIDVFALGFGKELFGWNDKSGTRWKVCALPFGGYVKMYGDASAASNADKDALDTMSAEEKSLTFHHKSLPKKAAIVSAGPIANFLLTIVLLTGVIYTVGLPSTKPEVGEVLADTPAAAAGLQAGDVIERINNKEMKRFNDIPMAIATNLGKPITLQVQRGEKEMEIVITPKMMETDDGLGNTVQTPRIGIASPKIQIENIGFAHAVWEAVQRTYSMCITTLDAVGQIITGERSITELKSPVGIAKFSGQAMERGLLTVIMLMATLSANLGLINLFPIPVLDGGHLAYYAAEALRGRPLAEKVQEWGMRLGFAMIMTLMAVTIFNDVKQIFFS
jgi:regulator of sigma E protease